MNVMLSEIEWPRNEERRRSMEEKRSGAAKWLDLGKLTIEEIAEGFGPSLDEVRAMAASRAKG